MAQMLGRRKVPGSSPTQFGLTSQSLPIKLTWKWSRIWIDFSQSIQPWYSRTCGISNKILHVSSSLYLRTVKHVKYVKTCMYCRHVLSSSLPYCVAYTYGSFKKEMFDWNIHPNQRTICVVRRGSVSKRPPWPPCILPTLSSSSPLCAPDNPSKQKDWTFQRVSGSLSIAKTKNACLLCKTNWLPVYWLQILWKFFLEIWVFPLHYIISQRRLHLKWPVVHQQSHNSSFIGEPKQVGFQLFFKSISVR